jgi:hypothetical protein
MDSATTAEQVTSTTTTAATATTVFVLYFNHTTNTTTTTEREGVPAAGCCVRGRQAGGRQARQEARQRPLQSQHRLGLQDPQGGYACALC